MKRGNLKDQETFGFQPSAVCAGSYKSLDVTSPGSRILPCCLGSVIKIS